MASGSAWPVTAEGVAELPPPLDAQLTEQLVRGERIQRLVYVPADHGARRLGGWERTRGVQVLALTDQRVIVGVQAVRRGAAPWVAIPYDAVLSWEIGQTLLYGRLDICGQLDNQAISTYIEFNTVGLHLIEEALAPLELHTLGIARRGGRRLRQRIQVIEDLPYKFGNFLDDALLPGEAMRELVFQEAVVEIVFRVWHRLRTPGTVIAGTDRRLLVIREEPKLHGERYGHMALNIPRRWADGLNIQDGPEWLTLAYAPNPAVFSVPVARTHADALRALLGALHAESTRSLPDVVVEQAVETT